jgi:hypothetical protein
MITHAPNNHNERFTLKVNKNWSNSLSITKQLTENKRDNQEPTLRQYIKNIYNKIGDTKHLKDTSSAAATSVTDQCPIARVLHCN